MVREVLARHAGDDGTVVRPTLVLQPEAGSEIGRYFLGPLLFGAARLLPGSVARRLPLPLPTVAVSFVHADDVADAIVRMLDRRAPGPFNLAAEPLLDSRGSPARWARCAYRSPRRPCAPRCTRRSPRTSSPPSRVLDMGTQLPALDTSRARRLLDWTPTHRRDDVLARFVAALGRGDGAPPAAPPGSRRSTTGRRPLRWPDVQATGRGAVDDQAPPRVGTR